MSAGATAKLKVFISYSRRNVTFVDQLVVALEDRGFEPVLDRHDIAEGEKWEDRLGKLLLSADATVFVLTAESAASEVCGWEAGEAQRLGKRVLPVLPNPLGPTEVPDVLKSLNYIHFYTDPSIPGSGVYDGLRRLERALNTDLEWVREQTRLSERAAEWRAAHNEDLLLRGHTLHEAQVWLDRAPGGAVVPAEVREYISASADAQVHRDAAAKAQLAEREEALRQAEAAVIEKRKAERRFRRWSIGSLIAGVALLAGAAAAGFFAVQERLQAQAERAGLLAEAARTLNEEDRHAPSMLMSLLSEATWQEGMFGFHGPDDAVRAAHETLSRSRSSNLLLKTIETGQSVEAMAVDPKTGLVLTGHRDGTAKLWRLGERDPVQVFRGLDLRVTGVAFFPGDKVLLAHGAIGMVLVYSTATGERLDVFPQEYREIIDTIERGGDEAKETFELLTEFREEQRTQERARTRRTSLQINSTADSLQMLSDGSALLSVSTVQDTFSVVFDNQGAVRYMAPGDSKYKIQLAAFFPDDATRLVTVSADGVPALWRLPENTTFDTASQIELDKPTKLLAETGVSAIELLPDGPLGKNLALLGYRDGSVKLMDLETGIPRFTLRAHGAEILDIASDPDELMFLTGSEDGSAALWRISEEFLSEDGADAVRQEARLVGHDGAVRSVAFDTDSRRMLTGSRDGSVKVWSLPASGEVKDVEGIEGLTFFLGVGASGHVIAYTEEGAQILAPAGEQSRHIDDLIAPIYLLSDGERYLVGDDEGHVYLKRIGEEQPLVTYSGHEDFVNWIAGFEDGQRFLSTSDDGTIKLWRLDQTDPLTTFVSPSPDAWVQSVAISPNQKLFAAGSDEGIDVWSVDNPGTPVLSYKGHANATVWSIAFLGDDLILSSDQDGGTRLWRISDGETVSSYTAIFSVVHPDGLHYVVTDGASATIWSRTSTQPLETLQAEGDLIVGMAVSPLEPDKVLFVTEAGKLRVWSPRTFSDAGGDIDVREVCAELAAIGLTQFEEADARRFPILRGRLYAPCDRLVRN